MLPNAKILAKDQSLLDDFIISRVLAGYTEEYEILIRRYNPMLYKSARAILSNETDIEDVMQEAYIRGYEKLGQFRKEAKFSTWLVKIVINCALQHVGKSKRMNTLSLDSIPDDIIDCDVRNDEGKSEDTLVRDSLKKAIETAVSKLPIKFRTVFILREIEKLSVKNTSEALDISEENVKIRLYRARTLLKEMLTTEVNSIELFEFHDLRCDLVAKRVMALLTGVSA